MQVLLREDIPADSALVQSALQTTFSLPATQLVITKSTYEMVSRIQGMGNLYILDIERNFSVNGVILAQHIREADPLATLILLSRGPVSATKIINSHIQPFALIDKNHYPTAKAYCDIFSELLAAQVTKLKLYQPLLNRSEDRSQFLTVTDEHGIHYQINPADILFAENHARRRKVSIQTTDQVIVVNMYLSTLKTKLQADNFFNGFQSYIINIENIRSIDKQEGYIDFGSDRAIFLSQSLLGKVLDYTNQYWLHFSA